MVKKLQTKLFIFLIFIFALSISIILNKTNDSISVLPENLKPFNEVISVPDYYRVTDYDNWHQEKPPTKVAETESTDISVIIQDKEMLNEINKIINSKNYTPIMKEEFKVQSNNLNKDTKFWISTSVDYDTSLEYFYAYQILITKNYDMYILVAKGSDDIFIKTSISEKEFNTIKDLHDKLESKKEIG